MNSKILLFVLLSISLCCAKDIYDSKKSYVTPLNRVNWKHQIDKIRQTTGFVSVVQFFKYDDGFSQGFQEEFDTWTNENRGLFRIGAVDCDEDAALCEKQGVTKFPTFRIYPQEPFPAIDLEGEITTKLIQQKAGKQLQSNVIEISNTNISTFISESPSVPKVFLFTKQEKGTPMIYKGLSVAFEKKLFFGLVRASDDILVDRYGIKKFPSIILVKTGDKKPHKFDGDMKFNPIYEFLNVYSEAFVAGGGSTQDSSASKSWLTEIVPELHQKSANDICFQVESALCVIHIGKGKPEKNITEALKELNVAYDRKIDRGSKFKFMWLDADQEADYAKAFEFDNKDKIVVLNPGKRKRYFEHPGDLTFDSIKQSVEKIVGGEARFVRVDLPQFAFRKDIQ